MKSLKLSQRLWSLACGLVLLTSCSEDAKEMTRDLGETSTRPYARNGASTSKWNGANMELRIAASTQAGAVEVAVTDSEERTVYCGTLDPAVGGQAIPFRQITAGDYSLRLTDTQGVETRLDFTAYQDR